MKKEWGATKCVSIKDCGIVIGQDIRIWIKEDQKAGAVM